MMSSNSSQDNTKYENRSLNKLRASLDAIDHEILQLLSKRMNIIAKVAEFKRERGIQIRDTKREQEILKDRSTQAKKLGFPPSVIQAIYRLLLLASRDHQAMLKAELPARIESKCIAIIGGKGEMGQCMAKLFQELGHRIICVDLDSELHAAQAASMADIVIVSVPIRKTIQIIKEIGPHISKNSLLMDVTSIKEDVMKAMLCSTKAHVIGMHPMFGPGVHSFSSQRVILCPGRGTQWLDWLQVNLHARGLTITKASAKEHDQMMAVIQVLNHFQTQVFGLALSRLGLQLEDTLRFTSPAYLLETYIIARHFSQSSKLYGAIEMLNPESSTVLTHFCKATEDLAQIIRSHDQTQFDQVFSNVQCFFGKTFTNKAQKQSGFLIDRLIELDSEPSREND